MSDTQIARLNEALENRYHIESELGEGGMATVYLADDLRHERKVALKVLKPELAAVVGGERFLAEIKTTANLQHPHILPLFDSGEAGSFLFYVMPYIDGETLADKIQREKQLPVGEAVRIAGAVANALHTAHEAGVVHRDIKPGNILLSRGEPLVADFGIALAVGAAGGSRLTETGLSVGTPYYMSPEQATGDQALGPASDTYALACVLYEMLTGDPPYMGSTAQAVLGKILQSDPVSATAIRKSIPLNVDAAIRKALEKLPADRFTDAHDFAAALVDVSFRHGVTGAGAATGARSTIGAYAGWGVAAVLAGTLLWGATRPAPPVQVERFSLPFESGQELEFTAASGYSLSPDGRMLVYRHVDQGNQQVLMVRRWDELVATPVRETGGAMAPAVSPDGEDLAFVRSGGEIQVLALAGGPVRTLGEGTFPVWSGDGYVYATGPENDLIRMPAGGGPAQTVVERAEGDAGYRAHDVLPGDEGVLYTAAIDGGGFEVRVLDVASGESRTLVFGADGRYAASGHLVYLADGSLMAAPFDPDAMEVRGDAVAMEEDVEAYSLSDTGKLLYTLGSGGGGNPRQLVYVTRDGDMSPIDPDWMYDRGDANHGFEVSPDGRRLVLREQTEDGYDIWVKQLDQGPRSRLTFDAGWDGMPVWAPDGRTVTFLSDRGGDNDVWSRPGDGTGRAELVFDFERSLAKVQWSPDGEWLILRTAGTGGVEGGRDIFAVRPGADAEVVPLMAADFDEIEPDLSPDGRWIAYSSNETGRYEAYVRPFPDVDSGRWQVSVDGGFSPKWAPDGSEIFFVDNDRSMVAAEVDTRSEFSSGRPETLFEIDPQIDYVDIALIYDITRDGRFVMARESGGAGDSEGPSGIVLVNNFFEELRARAGR